ncbi:MAG: anion permease [Candidatus Ratteibacteria bacterium]
MVSILLILISIFWAMNMGGSGYSVSFAPSVGAGIIKKEKAVFLFTLFVLLGSLFAGINVVKTLSSKIVPSEFLKEEVVLIVLFSSSISLFIANILKIPQSTSMVTIGSFIGAGIYFNALNLRFLPKIFLTWIFVSFISYYFTYLLWKKIYPPSFENLKIYEKIFLNKNKLEKWVLLSDYYRAFGIGTNNVANVVGPLFAAKIILPYEGFLTFSLIFGIGGYIFGRKIIGTVSNEIIPLGIASSSIISLVVSSLIILCSVFGIPAPYVQFSTFSILAIHTLKEGKKHIDSLNHSITRKIIKVWIITPFLSGFLTYILLSLLKK